MRRALTAGFTIVLLLTLVTSVLATTSTVVLAVDGMT